MSVTAVAAMLVSPIADLLGKFIPDKDKANQLAHDIATMASTQAHEQALGQMEVNKVEASHHSIFVSGARPAIMWICGAGLGYNILIHPIMSIWFTMPPVEAELLYPTLMGMLGLGGMRSFDKAKGVARP
jgi:hypothetical protein